MNLQALYDLETTRDAIEAQLKQEVKPMNRNFLAAL